jgi:hypothetical protein
MVAGEGNVEKNTVITKEMACIDVYQRKQKLQAFKDLVCHAAGVIATLLSIKIRSFARATVPEKSKPETENN